MNLAFFNPLNQFEKTIHDKLCRAYESLIAGAQRNRGSVNSVTVRSDHNGHTEYLDIPAPHLAQYFQDTASILEDLDPDRPGGLPIIDISLDYSEINGDLHLELDNVLVRFRECRFRGNAEIVARRAAQVHLSASHFYEPCKFIVSTGAHLSFNVDNLFPWGNTVAIEGVERENRAAQAISITTIGELTCLKQFMIARCSVKRLDMQRVKFNSSFDVIDCELHRFLVSSSIFEGPANFKNCYFYSPQANFLNSKFKQPADFESCTFAEAPDFHGAELHQSTRFKFCTFIAAGSIFKPHCNFTDVASYRVLKSHFNKQKDSRQEIFFYALEQRAERFLLEGDSAEKLLSWSHDLISSYGQSLSKSFLWFFAWNFLIFNSVYLLFFAGSLSLKAGSPFENVSWFALALQNAFNPLALFSDKGVIEIHSKFLYFLSLFQALGSIGILALILLSIRAKFRKGSSSES
jgi:hypothetical protein